jgi:glucokinase
MFFHSRLWEGDHLGFVAEIGHLVVHPEGAPCACGSQGCLETHASATALLKGVENAAQNGALLEGPLFDRWRQQSLSAEIIYQCALARDETTLKLFHRMGYALGLALSNLFTVLGIRHAILGGGVSASWDLFIGPLRDSFTRYARFLSPEEVVVMKSSLGDNAALLGAARHAMDQVS